MNVRRLSNETKNDHESQIEIIFEILYAVIKNRRAACGRTDALDGVSGLHNSKKRASALCIDEVNDCILICEGHEGIAVRSITFLLSQLISPS